MTLLHIINEQEYLLLFCSYEVLNLSKSLENISKIFYENDYKNLMNIKELNQWREGIHIHR